MYTVGLDIDRTKSAYKFHTTHHNQSSNSILISMSAITFAFSAKSQVILVT